MLIDTKKLKEKLRVLGINIDPKYYNNDKISLEILQFALTGEEKAKELLKSLKDLASGGVERFNFIEKELLPQAKIILDKHARRDGFIIND